MADSDPSALTKRVAELEAQVAELNATRAKEIEALRSEPPHRVASALEAVATGKPHWWSEIGKASLALLGNILLAVIVGVLAKGTIEQVQENNVRTAMATSQSREARNALAQLLPPQSRPPAASEVVPVLVFSKSGDGGEFDTHPCAT